LVQFLSFPVLSLDIVSNELRSAADMDEGYYLLLMRLAWPLKLLWSFGWCLGYGIFKGTRWLIDVASLPHRIPGAISRSLKKWREKRKLKATAKEAKLLEAHQADPSQEELRRYAELRKAIPARERELAELKREKDALEARHSGNYREPALVLDQSAEQEKSEKKSVPRFEELLP
jgi:cell division septum initiation protein DivIVA